MGGAQCACICGPNRLFFPVRLVLRGGGASRVQKSGRALGRLVQLQQAASAARRQRSVGANLEGAFLSGTSLASAKLANANLQMSELVRTSFKEADLSGANLEKSLSSRADFTGANLKGARLVKAEFLRVSFDGADLPVPISPMASSRATASSRPICRAPISLAPCCSAPTLARPISPGLPSSAPISTGRVSKAWTSARRGSDPGAGRHGLRRCADETAGRPHHARPMAMRRQTNGTMDAAMQSRLDRSPWHGR